MKKRMLRTQRALWLAVLTSAYVANRSLGAYSAADTVDFTNGGFNYQISTGITGTQVVGYGQTTSGPYSDQAGILWSASSSQTNILEPATGYSRSQINATNGLHQAGELVTTGGQGHAVLATWATAPGTSSYLDLHPAAYTFSEALSISGLQQVGDAQPSPGVSHAALWNSTVASFTDLNSMPTVTFAGSVARGTNGTQQVGDGTIGTTTHAVLWNGALSVADLHPASGYITTGATGISGNEEVGQGNVGGNANHALLWHGTAASKVDLHPTGYFTSGAQATNGSTEAGFGQATAGGSVHALMWTGSAASKIDLHALIPGAPTDSYANAIDVYGNISGYAFYGAARHAIVWFNGDTYTGFSNTWSSPGNWESVVPPVAGHDVLLIPTLSTTPTLDYPTGAMPTHGKMVVDNAGGGNMQLNIGSSATMHTASDVIGWIGHGSIVQTGGTHLSDTSVEIGRSAGSIGSYTIGASSGLAQLTAESVTAGNGGVGTFTQNSGSAVNTLAGSVVVGSSVGGSGTYQMNAGTLSSDAVYVGDHGTGVFDMVGGTTSVVGNLNIASASGGAGSFTIHGGNVNCANVLIGNGGGVGSFHVLGGTATASSGVSATGAGSTVELSGGTLTLGALNTSGNPSRLNWTGGTLDYTTQSPLIGASADLALNLNLASGKTLRIRSASQFVRILSSGSINFSGGKLDLTDKKLISQSAANPTGTWNGSNYTGISGAIQSGRNGGGWGGNGIVTSMTLATSGNYTSLGVATAAQAKGIAATATSTWAGQTVTGADTLVMYTYGGDATLDGKINVDDYTRIDFNVPLGTAGWYNGDFNYDGKINVDDYTIIDFNIGIQGASLGSASGDNGLTGVTAVPEPGSAGIIISALGCSVALAARRRRC